MNHTSKNDITQGFYLRRSFTKVLKLRGLELWAYAIIHTFTEYGEFKAYISNYHYISEFTGKAKSSVNKALHSLIEKKLVIKTRVNTDSGTREAYVADMRLYKALIDKYITDKYATKPDETNGEDVSVAQEGEGAQGVAQENKSHNIPNAPKREGAQGAAAEPMSKPPSYTSSAPGANRMNSAGGEQSRDSSYGYTAAEYKMRPLGSFRGCHLNASEARLGFEAAMKRSYGDEWE